MNQLELFSDDGLADTTRVRTLTLEIKALVKRTANDVIEIGKRLLEVKALLEHGQFCAWLSAEFGWTERTAQRLMSVARFSKRAEAFKSDNLSDLEIAPSALYMLASPSVPESARAEALERAESGEVLSVNDTKALIAKHSEVTSETKEIIAKHKRSYSDETSFLDTFIDAHEVTSETTETDAALTEPSRTNRPELVKLNLLLLPADRDVVMETLNAVKQTHGLDTHAQALVWLVNDWRTE